MILPSRHDLWQDWDLWFYVRLGLLAAIFVTLTVALYLALRRSREASDDF